MLAVWQGAFAIVIVLRVLLVGWIYAYLTRERNYDPFDQNGKLGTAVPREIRRGRDIAELTYSFYYQISVTITSWEKVHLMRRA